MSVPQSTPIPAAAPPGTGPVSARLALTLLVLINLFNYIDRQALAAVEPEIERELKQLLLLESADGDVRLIEGLMGLLPFAFLVSYTLLAPAFGMLADRITRWWVIGFGIALWSLASGASGLDWGLGALGSFWALFATRCFVGVGEAAYGPVAPAMIADLFPPMRRGKVMAWFYLALPVGGALGYAWGELVSRGLHDFMGHAGWRWAFFTLVPPGLLLGVWCMAMRDPPRGQYDGAEKPTHRSGLRDWGKLLRIPSYLLNTLGMTMMSFAIGGLAYWMPEYLVAEQATDFLGIPPRTFFGGLTAFSGLLGTIAGGWLGDRLRERFSGSYFLVSGAALILGFPMVLGMLWAPFPLAWLFIALAVFCLFFNTGPSNAVLANVTHPAVRANAFALNILIIHLLGDAISPFIISGLRVATGSLKPGFLAVSVAMLVGGLFWLWGARYLERDTALASTRM